MEGTGIWHLKVTEQRCAMDRTRRLALSHWCPPEWCRFPYPGFYFTTVNVSLQIRESIKALFPNRTCFPLVRPMSDESQLQRLEAVPPSQLRPEFQQVRWPFRGVPLPSYVLSA